LECSDWYPIAQENAVSRDRGDSRSGGENADQVQRIRGADRKEFAFGFRFADRAQQPDGLGSGELFAAQSADEIPASHLSACFKSSKNADEFKPGNVQGLFLRNSA